MIDGGDHDESRIVYRVRVLRTFKGSARGTVQVFTELNSGGYQLDVNRQEEQRLVFGAEPKRHGRLTVTQLR